MRAISKVCIRAVCLICIESVAFVSLSVPSVRAGSGTPLPEHISADMTLDAAGSPYMLDPATTTIDQGVTLHVMPGASIIAPPGTGVPFLMADHATVVLEGAPDDPIDISGTSSLLFSGGTLTASYVRFHDGPSVHIDGAAATMSSSTLSRSYGPALFVTSGTLRAWNMLFEGDTVGLSVAPTAPGTQVSVTASSFIGNNTAVLDLPSAHTSIVGDWWGDPTGPTIGSGTNAVLGSAVYAPWLSADPGAGLPDAASTAQVSTAPCCSSVLFIPGIEATRLYNSTFRLWEPLAGIFAQELYLDDSGSSKDRSIYAGEPIDSAFGLKGIYDVYGGFERFMDSLVGSGFIHEWRAFGYDWREPIDMIAVGDVKRATTTERLADAVTQLAAGSKTGKVTIVAHSNGGLVAKYLVKALADAGRASLIDSVISVGVPYLGAPEAVAGLLHGDGQSIFHNIIVSEAVARSLGQNMASAYSLLPSAAYFLKGLGPSIAFASTTIPGLNDGSYRPDKDPASGQDAFIADTAHVRMQPASSDVASALVGNSTLMRAAEALHVILDPFQWPAAIESWAIAGWDRDTTETVAYSARPGCDGFLGKLWCRGRAYIHDLITTAMGDGTVPLSSAVYGSGTAIFEDLGAVSRTENGDYAHASLLESSTTQGLIRSILADGVHATSSAVVLPGVTVGVPDLGADTGFIELSTYGDVDLEAYDDAGFHTGLLPTVKLLKDDDAVSGTYEEKIPKSSFHKSGTGDDTHTTIKLPTTTKAKYTVKAKGKDYGFFTVAITKSKKPGVPTSQIYYGTEPDSPIMVATTTIDTGVITDAGDGSIASSVPPLAVDIDGDGTPDYIALPGGNGVPGNATSTSEADQIARDETLDVLQKTDGKVPADDPNRTEILNELFPPGTNGAPSGGSSVPTQASTTAPSDGGQKTPPGGGADCVPRP